MKRWWMGVVLLAWMGLAVATGRVPAPEISMVVQGSIEIDTDGQVIGYRLKDADKLPPQVVTLLATGVPQWRFHPVVVDGHAASARNRMSIRVVGSRKDKHDYVISIASVSFYGETAAGEAAKPRLQPPRFPMEAARAGVGGAVYLTLRVDREGRVVQQVAEQVNLNVRTGSAKAYRNMLSDAALQAAAQWQFEPASANDPEFRSMRTPVEFFAPGQSLPQYGQWQAYAPGPRQPVPWELDAAYRDAGADAIAGDGGPVWLERGLKLRTPLGGT